MLGVIDIVYSLDEIDRKLRTSTLGIAGFSLGFIAFAALLVGFFVHRLVYVPLRDLEGGAQRLSSGNLDQPIPVRSDDEFGNLAASFNTMTGALRHSRAELQDWGHTLEQKVEERTEELRRAQAETMRGEKLASVGLLASGVAHELNNPLTGILTFSHLVRQNMPDKSADCGGHGPGHPRNQALRRDHQAAARFRPREAAGKEIHRSQSGHRRYGADRRAAGAPTGHRDQSGPRPHAAADLDRRRPDQAGGHEHPGQCPARSGGEGEPLP